MAERVGRAPATIRWHQRAGHLPRPTRQVGRRLCYTAGEAEEIARFFRP